MSLFPSIQPAAAASGTALPLAREVAWDFDNDVPVFSGGAPKLVTGLAAVKVWAWNALNTVRRKCPIWTRGYGNDMEGLIGRNFTSELKTAEAARYVSECLLTSPYISSVSVTDVGFDGDTLSITAQIKTIYGEAEISV